MTIAKPTAPKSGPTPELLQEFNPSRLLPSLAAGLVCAVLTIFIEVSFAVMIFSGSLVEYVSAGIGFLLFGAIIINIVVSLTSSLPGTIALPQDTTSVILALMAVSIIGSMPGSATPEAAYFSVVASIIVSSLLTGVFLLLLGQFKLGNLIRFVPYPVLGGFLAGTGWLLIRGGISLMLDTPLNFSQFSHLFEYNMLVKWLPGFILAVLMLLTMRRTRHFLIMPAMLVAAFAIFYLLLLVTNTSIPEATAQGWLLGAFPRGALWQPLPLSSLAQVEWSVVFKQIDSFGALLIITVISLLLGASGIESAVEIDIDLNRELLSTGAANIAAAFGSGPVGYHVLSQTVLGNKMAPSSRLVGLSLAAFCGIILFWGGSLLSLFPRPVLGGLIIFLGLNFVIEWVYDARAKLPTSEYFLMLLIFIVVGAFGFLEGVGTGIIVAVVLFVVNYSRINVLKHELTGASYQSNVDRPLLERQLLSQRGEQVYILKLQGFIFFGTAHNLFNQVRFRAIDPSLPPLQFVVFDFRLVSGLDSSALNSFSRMKRLAQDLNITLVYTHLSLELRRRFEAGGYIGEEDKTCKICPDLDHGVEWCEDQLLLAQQGALIETKSTLQQELKEVSPEFPDFTVLMKYFQQYEVREGQYLMRQGDPPKGLFLVESGQVTVQLDRENAKPLRLRTMGTGAVIGELGLYLGTRASASVVTNKPSTIFHLSMDKLQLMEETDPEIAAIFHKFIVRILCERLAKTNNTLKALLD